MRSYLAIFIIALRRIRRQIGLNLLALCGVTFAVAFCSAIPLYTNTIYNRLLQTELYDKRRSMPVFGLLFRYSGNPEKALAWDDIEAVSDYIDYHTAPALGLPKQLYTRFITSPSFDIYEPGETRFEKRYSLTPISFGTQSDILDYITFTEAVEEMAPAGVLDVLASEQLLMTQGWYVGQTFNAVLEQSDEFSVTTVKIPFRIQASWRRTNPDDAYWFFNPTGLVEDLLLLPEHTYAGDFAPSIEDQVGNALWYLILDGDAFLPNHAEGFLRRLNAVTIRAANLLPNIELMVAPAAKALRNYQTSARWLTVTLFAFSIPALSVIGVFQVMVVRLIIDNQRSEIAVLRSRGASEEQTLGVAILQGMQLGMIALILGIPLGRLVAVQMTRAKGFLDFSGFLDVHLILSPAYFQISIAVIVSLVLLMVVFTYGLLKTNIVRHHQEVGRSRMKSWWHKTGIDFILLAIALYGVIQLRMQQGLTAVGDISAEETIKQNPLLYFIPALCSLSLTLLALRILPLFSTLIAGALTRTKQVSSLLAVRQIARQPGGYTAPLLLLILTLSLALFTSSMAVTLHEHELTEAYRDYGTDLRLFELGESTEIEINLEVERLCLKDPELPCPWENKAAADAWIEDMGLRDRPRWRFLPAEDHLKITGIKAASPVGQYRVEALSRELGSEGVYMGIDRSTFVDVAYWEGDFAEENLGALMNALALAPERMLVSRDIAEQLSLRIGDRVPVEVRIDEPGKVGQFQEVNLILEVAGFVDGFPTWNPEDGPLFIGNLPYLFQEAGGQFPHHVWLKTDGIHDPAEIYRTVKSQDFNVQTWNAPDVRVTAAFNSPEYQGIMGLLSTGFLISACLTIVGLLLYVFFSYKRRSIEVGTLRAIGLAKSQVTTLMIWELLMLMVLGTLGGTGIGLGISRVLIPYMRFGEIQGPRVLAPIAVHFSWHHMLLIYGLFSALFGVMIAILITALSRIKIYAVLKMGDTM